MADEKMTDLDAHGAFADTDLIEVVDDPAGTPDNEKAEVGDLLDYAAGRNVRASVYASIPAASAAGLLTLITDGATLARDGGAAHVYYGPIWRVVPLDQSGWSWVNQGSASVTQGKGIVFLAVPGAGGTNVRGRVTSAPAAPYVITAAVMPSLPGGTHAFAGIGFRESSSGKIFDLHIYNNGGGTQEVIRVVKWTNETTVSTVPVARGVVAQRGPVWLRIEDNNTNVIFSTSPDGVNWIQLFSEARGSFMSGGGGPTQVGLFAEIEDTSTVGGLAASYLSWEQT